MKRILLFLVFVVTGYTAGAQLKDLMKNKANSMLNKGSKTESTKSSTPTSDSTANKAGTSVTSGSADQQGAKSNGGWGGFSMGSKSDIAAEYNFAHNMHIEMESVKKGETTGEKHQMIMYMGKDNSNYSGVEMKTDPKKPEDKMISVYEYEKTQSVTYMHSDGKKSVMVSKYNASATDTAQAAKGPRFTKTGRTKTILTYKCEEWVGTDEKGNKYEVWVTNDLNIPVNEYLKKNAEAQKKRNRGEEVDYSNMPKGLMMEMTNLDKEGNKNTWKVTAVNMNQSFTIKTSEYEYMGF